MYVSFLFEIYKTKNTGQNHLQRRNVYFFLKKKNELQSISFFFKKRWKATSEKENPGIKKRKIKNKDKGIKYKVNESNLILAYFLQS